MWHLVSAGIVQRKKEESRAAEEVLQVCLMLCDLHVTSM